MEAGAGEHWDYDPPSDASQQYVKITRIGPLRQSITGFLL